MRVAPGEPTQSEKLAASILRLVGLLWLSVLIAPIEDLARLPTIWIAPALAGVIVFVALYLWVWHESRLARPLDRRDIARVWGPTGVLAGLATGYSIVLGPGWENLFVFAAVAAAVRLTTVQAAGAIAAIATLGGLVGYVHHEPLAILAQGTLLIGGISAGVATVSHSVVTARELRASRAEVARLAVSEERLRFARDLHDLLGHSLSLVALKCDLAKQLIPIAPERAIREVEDAETVARAALREVREAVAGYRQPTLADEVAGAKELLAAAGIRCAVVGSPVVLPASVETALAWALREAVTNVIRHSRAQSCTISVERDDVNVCLTVTDDGVGSADPDSPSATRVTGSGIAGLRERVEAIGGHVEAGRCASVGFRLAVRIPVAR